MPWMAGPFYLIIRPAFEPWWKLRPPSNHPPCQSYSVTEINWSAKPQYICCHDFPNSNEGILLKEPADLRAGKVCILPSGSVTSLINSSARLSDSSQICRFSRWPFSLPTPLEWQCVASRAISPRRTPLKNEWDAMEFYPHWFDIFSQTIKESFFSSSRSFSLRYLCSIVKLCCICKSTQPNSLCLWYWLVKIAWWVLHRLSTCLKF